MKNKYLCNIPVLLFAFLVNFNNAAVAASLTFSSTPVSEIISETSDPFSSKVNYDPSSWDPINVTSASLRIFLSDDVSRIFAPNIDAPREWASLTSVTDGAESVNGLPNDVEVDPQLFDGSVHGTAEADAAAAAGIENPSELPSIFPYFDLDVTSLIQLSNSGMLNFSLEALNLYDDVLPGTSTHDLILAEAFALNVPVPPDRAFPVFEDFIFNQAELTVEFDQTSAVPAPSAFFLIGIGGLSGLLFNRKKKHTK